MSFSHKVKEELATVLPQARHCQLAELAAIISMSGHLEAVKGGCIISISSDNKGLIEKTAFIIKKAFTYEANIDNIGDDYLIKITDLNISEKILLATKILGNDGINSDLSLTGTMGISNICCKRAFLRGAFLASGSITDPQKQYHFEIVTQSKTKAELLVLVSKSFELDTKIIFRRNYYVVYIKDGEGIADMLNVMGAHLSLMELENVRVVKEVRNKINRRVNCETANIGKVVKAARKQVEDIEYIEATIGLSKLSEQLEEIARLRLEFDDMPLKDLGEKLSPPVGKSGVNHRLRKISEIADELRNNHQV